MTYIDGASIVKVPQQHRMDGVHHRVQPLFERVGCETALSCRARQMSDCSVLELRETASIAC